MGVQSREVALFFVKNEESRQVNTTPWWREGAMIFSEISAWIVAPIVLALVVGKKLDEIYGTDPWMFLGLAVLGFAVTAYGIIRSVKRYSKRIKADEKREKKEKQEKIEKENQGNQENVNE